MIINLDIYDKIFQILKTFLQTESKYSPIVAKQELRQTDKFPLVVFTEEDNSYLTGTTRFEETKSRLNYEINIYATDKAVNDTLVAKQEIARELAGLVDNVLGYNLKMTRRSCRPTPNLDKNIYRITMRYRTNLNDNTGKLY
jgi:hypothetical protein